MRHWPDRFLHVALRADADVLRRARLTVRLAVVLTGVAVAYALFYALIVGYPAGARILGTGAGVVAVALPVLRVRPWLRAAGHLLTGVIFGVVVALVACEGGVRALATPLLSLPPMLAVLLLGRRTAAGWTAACVVTIVGFGVAEAHGTHFAAQYPPAWAGQMAIGSPVALIICTALLLRVFETLRVDAQARADAANAALARLAYRDVLTGLPNRAQFLERLDVAVAGAYAAGDPTRVAVLLLDLDGFKAVNDSMGHAAGDALLAEVGARLLSATRGCDTVARLGGDEFAVLLDGVRADADASRVAARIVAALAHPVPLAAGEARIGTSLGIGRPSSSDPRDPRDESAVDAPARAPRGAAAAVLHRADLAMYHAKRLGGERWVWFEAGMLPPAVKTPTPAFGDPRDSDRASRRAA